MIKTISDEEIRDLRNTTSGIENIPDAVLKRDGWSVEKIKKALELKKAKKFFELGRYLAFGEKADPAPDTDVADAFQTMTALDMVRDAASYLELPLIATLQDSCSNLSSLMLSLLNRSCATATLQYDWNQLIINYHFWDISD